MNEKLITFIMKNMCLVHKQLLQRAFQFLLNFTAWAAIPIPKTPKLWKGSATREVYSQQERLCLGGCLLCSQQSLAPA